MILQHLRSQSAGKVPDHDTRITSPGRVVGPARRALSAPSQAEPQAPIGRASKAQLGLRRGYELSAHETLDCQVQ